MIQLRVLVADDELIARKRLIRLLTAIEGVVVVGESDNGQNVIERVRGGGVDLILLDIHMPGLTGLETAELLPDDGPLIVLCTAHPDHALEAFERGAIDYVMKPVEPARLKKAVTRARERIDSKTSLPVSLERIAVDTRDGIVLIDPNHISHAVLDGELVTISTDRGVYLSGATLGELQERLPASSFARVHRRALVNLECITRLEPVETGGFMAHMRIGGAVEVSRQSARELRKILKIR